MLVAAGQLCSSPDLAANGAAASQLIETAANNNARILFLPEASDYIAKDAQQSKLIARPIDESPFVKLVLNKIQELNNKGKKIDVLLGIHEPTNDSLNRTKNLSIYIDSNCKILQKYQKIHLFDVNIPNGPILNESKSVQPGNKLLDPINSPIGKIGQLICYDLRFPELAIKLRSKGCQILTYPSAWTVKTGPHFHILGKAIAILTQCFVILPAQFGKHPNTTRESYGHTCIIDPNGVVLSQCSNSQSLCYADIDVAVLDSLRNGMPVMQHRRPDLYTLSSEE